MLEVLSSQDFWLFVGVGILAQLPFIPAKSAWAGSEPDPVLVQPELSRPDRKSCR